MNERIRELAEEAGIVPGIMGLNRFTYFDTEKFAELIVHEICGIVEEDGSAVLPLVIKRHFGIE